MEKYLNCHKYKQMLHMYTHAYYRCITGRLRYCATLTFTATALRCGVLKSLEIHICNYISQHTQNHGSQVDTFSA